MFKLKNKTKKLPVRNGMTLIEVVVVIAIVGIMSSITITSFVTMRRDAALETAAEEVVAVLREAQNYSLTGKNLTSAACATYTVDFTLGLGSFILNNGGAPCTLNQSYSLKNGVTVYSVTATKFTAPHATTEKSETVIQKGSAYYTICVNTAGLIKKLSGKVLCP